jgi:protein-L-isoaspartate(D-aspartate) O-methyltransferase
MWEVLVARGRQAERADLVHDALEGRDIADPRVLAAMNDVPREQFVPIEFAEYAYQDRALPIGGGQTISQPYMVALMAQALELEPEHRVLEIGTGSGYGAAVLSRIAAEVYTVERIAELASLAHSRLHDLGYDNVVVRHADGADGWAAHAPYDGVVVTATAHDIPESFREQLAIGGRLVVPVADESGGQQLLKVTKVHPDDFHRTTLGPVRFVPLRFGRAGDPSL